MLSVARRCPVREVHGSFIADGQQIFRLVFAIHFSSRGSRPSQVSDSAPGVKFSRHWLFSNSQLPGSRLDCLLGGVFILPHDAHFMTRLNRSLTYQEIGIRLGLSTGRVQQIEQEALKKLRRALAKLGVTADEIRATHQPGETFKFHDPAAGRR